MITLDDLKAICPHTKRATLEPFVDPLNGAMDEFEVSANGLREAAFLAQAAHESGGFNYMRELASGEAYEGRADLGNTQPGWGVLYKGRGIFQLTGETNFKLAGTELYGDPDWLLYHPEKAGDPPDACRIAGWFWKRNGLNELADKGDFYRITRRINGGTNGWTDRVVHYERAKHTLGA